MQNPRQRETKKAHLTNLQLKLQRENDQFLKLQWRIEDARFLNSFGLSKTWAIQNRLKPGCFISVRMQLQWELSCCLCCELSRSKAFQKGFAAWLLTEISNSSSRNRKIYLNNNNNNDIDKQSLQRIQNLNFMDIEVLEGKEKLRKDQKKQMLIAVDIFTSFPAYFQSLQLEIRWYDISLV